MRRALPILILVLASAGTVSAEVEIVFEDGSTLVAASVERQGNVYLVTIEEGRQTLALPMQLVRQIRFTVGVPDEAEAEPAGPVESDAEGRDALLPPLEGQPAAEGEAGTRQPARRLPAEVRSHLMTEQLAAFGRDPAWFRKQPTSPFWNFDDELGETTDVTGFNPAQWGRTTVDPYWRADPVYEDSLKAPDFNTREWHRSATDPGWYPRDGWGDTLWFPALTSGGD